MGWASGAFTRARNWTADAAVPLNIEATLMDQEDDNFELGIDTCLTKDGQNTPTTDLPMDSNRHTGVGNATAKTNYASAADVIDQDLLFYVDTGAADAYVITPSPSIGAYEEGQRLVFRATNANTGATTLNVNALGATTVETNDAAALEANMIVVGGYYEVTYDANGSRFVLTSPHSLTEVNEGRTLTAGTGMTGGGDLSANRTFNVIGGTGITANANDVATDDSAIVHDNLSGFVADEHVAHGSVSVIAGTGLTGGGTIAASRTLNVIGGTGITANADDIATDDSAIVHDNLSGFVAGEHILHSGVDMIAGTGLTGGGTIAATRTFNVIGGTGITANANDIATDDSAIVHDDLSGFVADEHVLHAGVSVIAGAGMTGGGTISASRTLNVIAGDGIAVGADDVAVDISGLSALAGTDVAATDGRLVDDAGTMKRVAYQSDGVPIIAETTTARTLVDADVNTYIEALNASAITITLNTGVGEKGNFILIEQFGAGQVTIDGTSTVNAAVGQSTRTQYSVISLVCKATDVWTLYGDQTA